MSSILLLILGVAITPVFSGSPIFDGRCPTADVEVVSNFNQTKFQGFWYVIERYAEYRFMNCSQYEYKWDEENRRFSQFRMERGRLPENPGATHTELTHSVITEKVKNSNDGAYFDSYSKLQHYQFVDTDYENYAVMWICQRFGIGKHEQNLVVMARDNFFNINSLESLNATLAKPPFDRRLLKTINHTNAICERAVVV